MRLRSFYVLMGAAGWCLFNAFSAEANLLQALPEMGDLERWASFSLGALSEVSDATSTVGTTDIYGDVGVAGNGNITLTGNSTVHGDLYWETIGTLTLKGAATITGLKHHDAASDSILNNGVTEATNTSAHAATFASSFAYSGLTSITSSMTLTAQHDRPGNSTVLNLTDLVLGSQSTLTLNGTSSDVFIINISHQFSLTAQSRIVLTGGLAWDDVLFNVKGNGSTVTMDGQSSVTGIVMANSRTISLDGGAIVYGEVVANQTKLKGGAQIIHPPIISP